MRHGGRGVGLTGHGWQHPWQQRVRRRRSAPTVGRGACQHGKVGDEVRTTGDEEIGNKDEGELAGITGGDGKQRLR
jgi:hypothetical protein